jgi:hypothetical protein
MPDRERLLTAADDLALRIDLADQLDAALDSDAEQPGAGVLPLPSADAVVAFLSLATEIREVLHRPVLSVADRARIHGRALDLATARDAAGLRRAWPQLAHLAIHPAVIGGAAAAVLAVVGVAALQRRGHSGPGVLQAA